MGGIRRNSGSKNQFDCSPYRVYGLVPVSAGLSFPETNRRWSGLLFCSICASLFAIKIKKSLVSIPYHMQDCRRIRLKNRIRYGTFKL